MHLPLLVLLLSVCVWCVQVSALTATAASSSSCWFFPTWGAAAAHEQEAAGGVSSLYLPDFLEQQPPVMAKVGLLLLPLLLSLSLSGCWLLPPSDLPSPAASVCLSCAQAQELSCCTTSSSLLVGSAAGGVKEEEEEGGVLLVRAFSPTGVDEIAMVEHEVRPRHELLLLPHWLLADDPLCLPACRCPRPTAA